MLELMENTIEELREEIEDIFERVKKDGGFKSVNLIHELKLMLETKDLLEEDVEELKRKIRD